MSSEASQVDERSTQIGRYRLFKTIAAGGMATVHIGRLEGPAGFSRTVAIKRLHPQFARDPDFVSMLLDEARLAGRIVHPNVVSTLDVVTRDGEIFLVMDYVAGESLAGLLRVAWTAKKLPPVNVVISLATDMLLGLDAAHQAKSNGGQPLRIVHRDVSPQNLLVGADGIARVVDFGIAKALVRGTSTGAGRIKGKLAYMSPEQIEAGPVDYRSDIFSAGVVLWEALAGRRLFSQPDAGAVIAAILSEPIAPPSRYRGAVPATLDAVVAKALDRNPDRRFDTAAEMADALAGAVAPAGAVRVSQWVKLVAGDLLDERAQQVADLESQNSGTGESAAWLTHDGLDHEKPSGLSGIVAVTEHPQVPGRSSRTNLWIAALVLVAVGATAWGVRRAWPTRHHDLVSSSSAGPPALGPSADKPASDRHLPQRAATPASATVQAAAAPQDPAAARTGAVPTPSGAEPALPSAPEPTLRPTNTPTPRKASPTQAPGEAALAPAPNCSPPFTIDSLGEKVFKPECF